MFSNSAPNQDVIIAGQHSGKPVTIVPTAKPVYDQLAKLARDGNNYWAEITVKAINELAAGRLHQSNIFVKPGAVHRNGTEEFVMILPGCKVTCEKLDADGFRILHFEADIHYGEAIKAKAKPGLYQASKINGAWKAELRKDGLIEHKEDRLVAISDSGYDNPDEAAGIAAPRIGEAPHVGSLRVNTKGFDLHFTPGEKRIGGLSNYRNAIRVNQYTELHESAMLLARTMYEAKEVPGVTWVSEDGGSGVLTQAMTIIAAQGIQLPSHVVFMFNPTTSPNTAVKAAHNLGVLLDRKFIKTRPINIVGNRDHLEMNWNRWKSENDSLTALQAGVDAFAYGKSLQGMIMTGATIAAGFAGVAGVSLTAPAALTTFLAAIGGALAAGKAVGTVASVGNGLVENLLPKHHDKLKGKF
ncbi:hypothetical protein [Thalassolituus sp. UBA3500]|uniref:hypothetical protein n=1 Tax=Thalassolituus sp. UBA3500 TaxID=1947664 RepID=UPI000C1056D8|nr:hypothetical protein [Thalassolituus sp. UBA3500]MBN57979.1 hypothetical protein [Oceanospirillaceae bacterium]|tara:strand:- start:819 stop:2057 length:1239 start_codon:yes stop_codon:yes gene_type:complete